MKQVKITRTTTASAKRVEVGKKYKLSARDADILVGLGKAEYVRVNKPAKADKVVISDGGPDQGVGPEHGG